jgi:hypothetical protein
VKKKEEKKSQFKAKDSKERDQWVASLEEAI